jgi:hypothetical protein
MSDLLAFLNSLAAVGVGMGELVQYGWRFLRNLFLPQAVLAARVLAAESQLASCQERPQSQGLGRHRFSDSFRWLWGLLARWREDWPRLWVDKLVLISGTVWKRIENLHLPVILSTWVGQSSTFFSVKAGSVRLLIMKLGHLRSASIATLASWRPSYFGSGLVFFADDLNLNRYRGEATGWRDPQTELLSFQDTTRTKPSLLRTGLRIRVSGRKAAALAQGLFSKLTRGLKRSGRRLSGCRRAQVP